MQLNLIPDPTSVSNDKNPISNKKANSLLDFLIIFNQDGLPIYSKCFSDICSLFIKNELLLSGFLSALTSFPKTFGYSEKELRSVDFSESRMYFSYSNKRNIVFVIGLRNKSISKDQIKLINFSMRNLQELFNNKFQNINWSNISDTVYSEVELLLNSKILSYWFLNKDGNFQCPHGEDCPFDKAAKDGRRKRSIWLSIRSLYNRKFSGT